MTNRQRPCASPHQSTLVQIGAHQECGSGTFVRRITRRGVAVGQFPNCLIEKGSENVLSHLPGPVVRLESTLGDDLDCPKKTQSAF